VIRAILLSLVLCTPTAALAGEWAGIPLADLPELGVESPSLSEISDGWRAPLAAGGMVVVDLLPDADAAQAMFASRAQTRTTRAASPLLLGDEAVGDGETYALVRYENVLISVQTDAGASAVAERLRGALVVTSPPGVHAQRDSDAGTLRWDAVGRRVD